MINDIKLYLCGMQVDFVSDPAIYYNFALTETTNPTVVKNSFSKTLQIEGTDRNNEIFGQIWDLSRFQENNLGNGSGVNFNPLKKAEFELYYNGALYETGYFKLTDITRNNNKTTYSITLYGGLGEFFANLSYGDDGNNLEFSDLKIPFSTDDNFAPDLEFDITKETVDEAWTEIDSPSSKYSIINFAPSYQGVPAGFDANKVLINESGLTETFIPSSYKNYALGEADRELTEWETFDLRSYLQKPVVRVKSLIAACCLPENNGGFEVDLGKRFFNGDNPYYEDSWVTLKSLKAVSNSTSGGKQESHEVTDAQIVRESESFSNEIWNVETGEPFSESNNLKLRIIPTYTPDSATTADTLYTSFYFKANNDFTLQKRFAKEYRRESAYLIQLRAYDAAHKMVAASDCYQLMSKVEGGTDFASYAEEGYKVNTLYGAFHKVGGAYVWCDTDNEPIGLDFTLNSDSNFTSIEILVKTPYIEYQRLTSNGGSRKYTSNISGARYVYSSSYEFFNGNMDISDVKAYKRIEGNYGIELDSISLISTSYEDFFSGTHITKKQLLTLGFTPADFLLSYCKMFGLYFVKDAYEKKISILDRSEFFRREVIENIDSLIDRGNNIKISPCVADRKYYDFPSSQIDSESATEYSSRYGQEYGMQRINTGYNFDNDNSKIYEGKFNGAIDVLEKSPYYFMPFEDKYPVYVWNGFKYTTFSLTSTGITGTERTIEPVVRDYSPINDRYNGFDSFPKPQFHKAGNEASEGDFVLLFYNGHKQTSAKYWITDDTREMIELNGKKPCWIMTASSEDASGNTIAIETDWLPMFQRNIVYGNTGFITHSWDFGKPLETYIPDIYVSNGMSIYEKCWKNYLGDFYDKNSRKVSCNVLFRKRLSLDNLRKFYWFDNSVWALNKITDWNPVGDSTTLCEFVKVQDINHYWNRKIDRNPVIDFFFSDIRETRNDVENSTRYYSIGYEGTTLNASIVCEDGGYWSFDDWVKISYPNGTERLAPYTDFTSPVYGNGNQTRVFSIPFNGEEIERTFAFNMKVAGSSGNEYSRIRLTQYPASEHTLSISPEQMDFTAEGGNSTLTITSNTNWTIE